MCPQTAKTSTPAASATAATALKMAAATAATKVVDSYTSIRNSLLT
jgi:hypothetical protein